MITNHTVYKYEAPYKVIFVIIQCLTNGMVNLYCDAIQLNYNIRRINPYTVDTKVEVYNSINMYDDVNI